MNLILDKTPINSKLKKQEVLFCVWINCNCDFQEKDWEINSYPKSLKEALDEATESRNLKFESVILLEGLTPRDDGFFTNLETEPDINA